MKAQKCFSKFLASFFGALIIFLLFIDPGVNLENEVLLLICNFLLTGLVPLAVAILAAKTYMKSGLSTAWLLSCGMLVFGLGSIATGVLRFIPDSPNVAITVYNSGALVSAACHILASSKENRWVFTRGKAQGDGLRIWASVLGAIVFTIGMAYAAHYDLIDPFIDSNGFTPLRNAVLCMAIMFYFTASIFFKRQYAVMKLNCIYWYSFSLMMITIGLFGVCFSNNVGTLMGWAGRAAQYIGAIAALWSMVEVFKRAKTNHATPTDIMTGFFADAEEQYNSLVNSSTYAILSMDKTMSVFIANASSERLFKGKLEGTYFPHLVEASERQLLCENISRFFATGESEWIGKTIEIRVQDLDGRVFPAEISFSGLFKHNGAFLTLFIENISQCKEKEGRIQFQNQILSVINAIYDKAMKTETTFDLADYCTDTLRKMTESDCCFACELREDGMLQVFVINQDKASPGEGCFDDIRVINPACSLLGDLYLKVIQHGGCYMENDIMAHSGEKLSENGHLPVTAFIGVPFKGGSHGIGMIGAVKKQGRFMPSHGEMLEALTPTMTEAIMKKRAEESVKGSESLMRTIMDSAADFLFIKDRDSRVVMVNKAYEKVFGVSIRDIIGKNDYDLYDDPLLAERVIANDREVMETGRTLVVEETGKTLQGYRTYSLSKTPWRDAKGAIIGVLGIGCDITEQKEREAELEKARNDLALEVEALEMLHRIYDQLTLGSCQENICKDILDSAITITGASKGCILLLDEKSGMFVMSVSHGLGTEFLNRFSQCEHADVLHFLGRLNRKKVVLDEATRHWELFEKPSLSLFEMEHILSMHITSLISGTGKIIGVLSTYYPVDKELADREWKVLDMLGRTAADVIERSQMMDDLERSRQQALRLNEELMKADRNKNEFISALSHELRNPLASIVAGLSFIDISDSKEKIARVKAIIQHQVEQLCRLVDDLLDLTRITRNKIELKKQRLNLCHLSSLAAEGQGALFKEKGICLVTEIPEDDLVLDADPVRLTQIIGNLLNNAVKFSKENGTVRLNVATCGNEAVIRVVDNGIGIMPDYLPYLFEPFVQADDSLDRRNGGLGLGLSIVKGIAELHGGRVTATSEGRGRGAEFALYLPLPKEDKTQKKEKHCHETGTEASQSLAG